MLGYDYIKNEYEFPKSKLESVEEAIRIDILTGAIRPGQWLVEKDLCERFDLSRTPIRQVLNQIAATGLIRFEKNRGAFAVGLSDRDMDDILFLRSVLEPQAVKWAIERITKEEMEMLSETFDFMEFYTRTDDMARMNKINRGFKRIIYDAAKNKELESTLLRYDFCIRYRNAYVIYPLNYLSTVLEEHREIYQAFLDHRPDEGFEAARLHAYKSMLRRK